MHHSALVSDALLKKLSLETQLIGRPVMLKDPEGGPEQPAVISNVIILPFSPLYREQFMKYYTLYKNNSVKALKELAANVPNTMNYGLDVGYVLKLSAQGIVFELNDIKRREDFIVPNELGEKRRDIFLSVVSASSTTDAVTLTGSVTVASSVTGTSSVAVSDANDTVTSSEVRK